MSQTEPSTPPKPSDDNVQIALELFENLYRAAYGDDAADEMSTAILKASWGK
jgi:hypothetical protein